MASDFVVQSDSPPFHEDPSGAIRVGDSRVLLEIVIQAFQNGATPETIVQQFDTLKLADVYAVIAYYLRHRSDVERYMSGREQLADEVRRKIEAHQGDLSEIRARIMGRRRS